MPSRATFYRNNLLLPLLLAAIVFMAFDLTDFDRWISNLLLDPATGQFPLLHNPLFERITHKWPRILPDWTGELAVIGSLLSFIWPRLANRPQLGLAQALEKVRIASVLRFTTQHRRDLLFVVVAFALSTTVIRTCCASTPPRLC